MFNKNDGSNEHDIAVKETVRSKTVSKIRILYLLFIVPPPIAITGWRESFRPYW